MSTIAGSTGTESSTGGKPSTGRRPKAVMYPGRPYISLTTNELASSSRPWAIIPSSMSSTWPSTEPTEEDRYLDFWSKYP